MCCKNEKGSWTTLKLYPSNKYRVWGNKEMFLTLVRAIVLHLAHLKSKLRTVKKIGKYICVHYILPFLKEPWPTNALGWQTHNIFFSKDYFTHRTKTKQAKMRTCPDRQIFKIQGGFFKVKICFYSRTKHICSKASTRVKKTSNRTKGTISFMKTVSCHFSLYDLYF